MAKEVVILGGGMADVTTAHKLLKSIAPQMNGLKIILVSTSSHFFRNISASRALVPGEISEEQIFYALEPAFSKYPPSQFDIILGAAKCLDTAANKVCVETAEGEQRELAYDHLGRTAAALRDLQAATTTASSIVIAGAGPTGVEIAGELGFRYGKEKQITLITDQQHLLPGCMPTVGIAAESQLAELVVTTMRGARVVSAEADGGKEVLTLSTGETLTADSFIPAYGLVANTDFVPHALLDKAGNLRVQRTPRTVGPRNVWGVGDATVAALKMALNIGAQVETLSKNLLAVLTGARDGAAEYSPSTTTMVAVPVGKVKGTGQLGWFKLFSWMVWLAMGKNYNVLMAPAVVNGDSVKA